MRRTLEHALDWPARQPRAALLLCGAMTVIALLLILRLKPETSLASLLDRREPAVAAMGRVLDDFPVVNEALVLATLPDDAPSDDVAPLLAFAERLRAAVSTDAEAKSLLTLARFRPDPHTVEFVRQVVVPNGLYYLSDQQVGQLRERLTPEGMAQQLQRDAAILAAPGPAAGGLAKAITKDPLRLHDFLMDRLSDVTALGGSGAGSFELGAGGEGGAFFSADRRSLLIRIGGRRSAGDFVFARQVTRTIDRLTSQTNADHLRIDVSGAYAMAAHSAAMIQSDSIADVVTTVVGLFVLFAVASRRPLRLFLFAFLPVLVGLVWGFGAYSACMHTITPLAAVVGGTLGAIGVDYTTNYITYYRSVREGAAVGSGVTAVRNTLRQMFWPSLAAWVTSVIGFAAVAASPVRVLRDFSILGTLCLVGAWLGTLLVLPAMLVVTGGSGPSPFTARFHGASAVYNWIARHRRRLVLSAAVILLLLCAGTLARGVHIEFESDPMILHPRPSPPLEAQRRITQKMQIAAGAILIHLQAADARQLLILAHDVHERLRNSRSAADAGVVGAFGLDTLLPDPRTTAKRASAFGPAFADRAAQDFRDALSQSDFQPTAYEDYVQFVKRLASPGPPPDLLTLRDYPELAQLLLPRAFLNQASTSPTEAITLIFTRGALDTREAREALLSAVREAVAGVDGATGTGTVAIGHDLERAVQRDLPRFIIIALVGIGLYLMLHFRSLSMSLLALMPIGVSMVFVIASFCLVGAKLNLLHSVMVPLLLGINLDYGIFAVHAWRHAHDEEDVPRRFAPAMTALMLCGGSTVIGFGSLILTSVPAVRSLGWLIAVGIISCVAGTLLAQWPVMLLLSRPKAIAPT
jgi:predicted RND superfamily exporter protein